MKKKNFQKLALYCLIIGAVVLLISYFFFHYVTDEGITFVFHEEAGKPFVTNLIANFGVLFLFSSAMSLMISLIFFKEEK